MNRDRWIVLTGIVVLLSFAIAWACLAGRLTLWSDELPPVQAAKGLWLTGKPFLYDLDMGTIGDKPYTHGYPMSFLGQFVYRALGHPSLFWFRVIPLSFGLVTIVFFLLFLRFSGLVNRVKLWLLIALFFSCAIVFDNLLFYRYYTLIGLCALLNLVAFWYGAAAIKARCWLKALMWALLFIAAFIYPLAGHLQIVHCVIIPVAGIILAFGSSGRLREWIVCRRKILVFLAAGAVILWPLIVYVCDLGLARVDVGGGAVSRTYMTIWDNLFGLARFGLALNIVILAAVWWVRDRQDKALNLETFLCLTGVISGLLIGFCNPHHMIFLARYYYVSAMLAVLGAPAILLEMCRNGRKLGWLLGMFLVINFALIAVTMTLERDNIDRAVSWVEQNLRPDDTLLCGLIEFEVHGGTNLVGRAHRVEASEDIRSVSRLRAFLEGQPSTRVLLIYVDAYHPRDTLYHWTTGESRDPVSSLDVFMRIKAVGKDAAYGLRNCGVREFDRLALIDQLRTLEKTGFEAHFKGLEKRWAKRIFQHLKLWIQGRFNGAQ
ncbi:MAG: hypothetical protein HQL20_00400 [Candidatus Omnitrophica bacterium]|nr:hypothetical protein [Candidatus Omnitrophota bacterium]